MTKARTLAPLAITALLQVGILHAGGLAQQSDQLENLTNPRRHRHR